MGAELGFSPAGLGAGRRRSTSASARWPRCPPGRLVERYGPTWSPARHRAGRRLLLAVGGLRAVVPACWSALLALGAAANALGQLASNAALARHVPARRQGLSFGVKQAAIPVSTLLAGAAVPAVALTVGLALGVRGGGGGRAAGGAAPCPGACPAGGPAGPVAHRAPGGPPRRWWWSARRRRWPRARRTRWAPSWWTPPAARGMSPGLAGLTLTLGGAVCVAARVGAGWLADRRDTGHVGVIAAMLVVGAVGLALLAVPGTVPLVVGVVLGFGLGWAWPGLMNFAVVRLHPQAPAAATSITQTGVYAGGCLGPLEPGRARRPTVGYPAMWTVAGGAMLLAAGLMLVGSRLLTRAGQPRRAGGVGSAGAVGDEVAERLERAAGRPVRQRRPAAPGPPRRSRARSPGPA